MASVAFATSTSCPRVELIKYLGDKSGKICRTLFTLALEHFADATQVTQPDGVAIGMKTRLISRYLVSVKPGPMNNPASGSSST